MNLVYNTLIWVHVLSMVGTFGGLIGFQTFLPVQFRKDPNVAAKAARFFSFLIGAGLIAGVLVYGVRKGHLLGPHFNGIIAVKFVILLAVGAALGMSKHPVRGELCRKISIALLALAAFLGTSLT